MSCCSLFILKILFSKIINFCDKAKIYTRYFQLFPVLENLDEIFLHVDIDGAVAVEGTATVQII